MNKLIAIILTCVSQQIAFAQPLDKTKLDAYFDALEANNKFMGSVALLQKGEVVYTRAIGYADVENKIKATPETKYGIGSVTKTFTAAMVMLAVEEKKLTLDQAIQRFFPTVPNASTITIRHLLSHRSGIHNFTNDEGYDKLKVQAKTRDEMIAIISEAGSDFTPDSTAAYSNSNYVLLSFMLEELYGKPYHELLKEKITGPLGLKNTYFGKSGDTDNHGSLSYNYYTKWVMETPTEPSISMGAGALISTATELTQFITALFYYKIVSRTSLREMMTIRDNLGLGLFVFPFYAKRAFGHTGGIDGYSALLAYFPKDTVAFAFVSNGNKMNSNDVAIAALSAIFNQPYEIPTFRTYDYKPGELGRYTGEYFNPGYSITITISEKDGQLIGQITGQPPFPLQAVSLDKFVFEPVDATLEFEPADQSLLLKQMGQELLFRRK